MRRWFIAIFALHFFLSVGALTFGELADVAPSKPDAVLSADTSAKHGLMDDLPDLPDSLPKAPLVSKPPFEGGSSIGYRPKAALTPLLAGLLRPPQPSLALRA